MLGNGVVGILREDCNKWERRAPLAPAHCGRLLRSGAVDRILVHPCSRRIFRDGEYQDVGCEISESLSDCGLVLGVKQPELGTLMEDRAYAFFSHTHKAQPENRPLLDEVLRKRVLLYDYELIADDHGKRLVAFGEFAGRAGMIDFLRGLGERLLSLGYSSPFLSLGSSYMYTSLSAAKAAVLAVGEIISSNGLPNEVCPLVFVFTGSGNVSKGAQEILKLLPHVYVDPDNLKDLTKQAHQNNKVYACVVTAKHMVAPVDPSKDFSKAEYYVHPDKYEAVFHKNVAPYASAIVNCMYWEHRYPPLLTNQQLHDMFMSQTRPRLLGISDITCDIQGSIQCLTRTTTIEQPFFRYDPVRRTYHQDLDGDGIFFMAIDILPTEFAKEATTHFGDVLYPFVSMMARSRSAEETSKPLRRACIASSGHLRPLYEYIGRISHAQSGTLDQQAMRAKTVRTMVSLSGHLFDKFLINEALDVIEKAGGQFHLTTCKVGQTSDSISTAEIEVTSESEERLSQIVDTLSSLATASEDGAEQEIQQDLENTRNVLVLGAGRMCEPTVSYLAGNELKVDTTSSSSTIKVFVYVGSLFLEDAQQVVEGVPNAKAVQIDATDSTQLLLYVSQVDVVVSLLPPSFHERVAVACIELGKHLVTASYVSTGMLSLHAKAMEANVTLLCEMGLDPGIDHMMAMKMIDDAHTRGAKVRSFVSYCGGLPSPLAADNPLGYKFSWNPAGAIKAGRNAAIYKHQDKIIEVPGDALLASAIPYRISNLPALALERLPNRDSLIYGDLYGLSQEAETIFRATLRYEGFSEQMHALGKLGYYDTGLHLPLNTSTSYASILQGLLSGRPLDIETIASCLGESPNLITANRVLNCVRFLGLDSEELIPPSCKSLLDVLCSQMETKLVFKPDEQDLVLLRHEVVIEHEGDRARESHAATLLVVGESSSQRKRPQSAMARTVGLTAAIGAELLLSKKIKSKGVIRPLEAEIYVPALQTLESLGLKLEECVEIC